jgi:hypothetical protein
MKMPRFTAEASLYKSKTSYRMAAVGDPSTMQIVPQMQVDCELGEICRTYGHETVCVPFLHCWEVEYIRGFPWQD